MSDRREVADLTTALTLCGLVTPLVADATLRTTPAVNRSSMIFCQLCHRGKACPKTSFGHGCLRLSASRSHTPALSTSGRKNC